MSRVTLSVPFDASQHDPHGTLRVTRYTAWMRDRTWLKRGPSLFGYHPGWVWWALAVLLFVGGATLITHGIERRQVNREYIDARLAYHAMEQGLDVQLVAAVVEAESGGDWLAESDAGAKGLMQVMPIALRDVRERYDVGPGDLFDPDYNLRVGTLYLRHLLDRFDGDVRLAVAAYHMGPSKLARGKRDEPGLSSQQLIDKHAGPKTKAYVERVLGMYDAAQ